ncbi:MAG: hypothetical protein HOL01_09775 [Planctomycetaceae bacterium]|jgi:hypothetical protein|nr:hypothetical protein [Planctomycetaceae bacterium]
MLTPQYYSGKTPSFQAQPAGELVKGAPMRKTIKSCTSYGESILFFYSAASTTFSPVWGGAFSNNGFVLDWDRRGLLAAHPASGAVKWNTDGGRLACDG